MTSRFGRRPLIAAMLAAPCVARAQSDWPSRPVRVVISWPPGGGADIPMRLAAPAMQQVLGQPLVLENRAGASRSVGAGVVARPHRKAIHPGRYRRRSVDHLLIPGLPC